MAMNRKEKGEIKGLRGELRSTVEALRGEFRRSMEELTRHMGVLVEGLRSEIRVVAEQYGTIIAKLERHDRKFEEHDRRFDMIDIELKAIKGALFELSHKVSNHEVRIAKLETAR